jgi:hypothetical protein
MCLNIAPVCEEFVWRLEDERGALESLESVPGMRLHTQPSVVSSGTDSPSHMTGKTCTEDSEQRPTNAERVRFSIRAFH